jgi:two-component system cell cycle response regulator
MVGCARVDDAMTVRRRLVAVIALFVAIPLTAAAVGGICWAASADAGRVTGRLEIALTGAVRALGARPDGPGLSAPELTALSPAADIRFTLRGATPPPSTSVFTRAARLPGGQWLVATTPSAPFHRRERRWALVGAVVVVALFLIAVAVSQAVLRLAVRPLDHLVRWAEAFTPRRQGASVTSADEGELDQLALAFRRVARDLRMRSEELHDSRAAFRVALERLGAVLGSTHDLEGILAVVVETALLVVPADAAVYYRLVGPPAKLQASKARGVAVEHLVLDGTGVAGYAALTGAVAMLPGPALPDPNEPAAVAAAAMPLWVLGRLVGVVGVYGTTVGRPFDEADVAALRSLLRQAEVAMANIELHAQARRDALTDGVTGLWNRRQFDLRCRDALLATSRFGEPFAVAIIDVDDFKLINDRYDHFTGDAALIHLAGLLRRSSRDVDVVARWGGEEFAILVQRGGVAEAAVVAERVCANLHADPLVYEGRTIVFTVSCGVASYPDFGPTAAEVVAAADAALLRAKAAGKDRVERAQPPPVAVAGGPARDLEEHRT